MRLRSSPEDVTDGEGHQGPPSRRRQGDKGSKSASKEILVVGSKMKDVVKAAGCMSSGDLIEALSAKVHEILAYATVRARATVVRRSVRTICSFRFAVE